VAAESKSGCSVAGLLEQCLHTSYCSVHTDGSACFSVLVDRRNDHSHQFMSAMPPPAAVVQIDSRTLSPVAALHGRAAPAG
jgi:hypothetical protein